MKVYTDLTQSKKLAEILPTETADMKWYFWKFEIDVPKFPTFGYSKDAAESYKSTEAIYLPCWSLSALLDALPYPSLHKISSGWRCDFYDKEGTFCISGELADNPIDACYKMIFKLKEMNLI